MVGMGRGVAMQIPQAFFVNDHSDDSKFRIRDQCQQIRVKRLLALVIPQPAELLTPIDDVFPVQHDGVVRMMRQMLPLE